MRITYQSVMELAESMPARRSGFALMLSDDQDYLSWMARAALAVLMAVVMFWIRGQMPDDAPVSEQDHATTADELETPYDALSVLRTAQLGSLLPAAVSAKHCSSALPAVMVDQLCGPGTTLRDLGIAGSLSTRDLTVLR